MHVSFVRSITMDQFKPEELVRMEKGGNELFNEYITSHGIDPKLPQKFKYDNPIANDYKQKLTCIVEEKEFVEPEHPDFDPKQLGQPQQEASAAAEGGISRQATSIESRRSPKPDPKEKNEAYFAELGRKNQSRPDHLPPSKGGKYQGFGSSPVEGTQDNSPASNTVSLDNFQKDPLGTFTKSWGLFSNAVTKSFEEVNESVIQPGYQQWQSGQWSDETKRAATQFGQKFQETSNYGIRAISDFTKGWNPPYDAQEGTGGTSSQYSKLPNGESSANQQTVPKKAADEEWEEF